MSNISFESKETKQSTKVTYLGCIFDETLSVESMAIKVLQKVNARLNFSTVKTSS